MFKNHLKQKTLIMRKSAYEQGLEENDWVYEDVEVDFDDDEYDVEIIV